MDLATLGVRVTRDGTVEAVRDLDRLAPAAGRAEKAIEGLNRTARDGAGAAYAATIEKASTSLKGFDAVAARAAEKAAYLTRQVQQLTSYDIRNMELQEYGKELDRLRAKFNPLFAASKQYEASLDEINYAHRVGAISAQEQAAAVARLDAQYEQAARSANSLSAANKSMRGSFHTTNLLFQAQDIAMMTAMGQAPMMLALQQGMQVGGIFQQIGNGRQIVQALGGAILGLLNPLNLATIAFIGLGAAGVQALMSMSQSWSTTRRTFEEHVDWLNKMLKGYDVLQASVGEFLDKASQLPASLARLEIGAGIADQLRELEEIQRSLATFRIRGDALFSTSALNEELSIIREFKAQLDGGLLTATDFAEKMLMMKLNPTLQSDSRAIVDRLYEMVRRAAELEAGIGGARLAMQGLSDDALLAAQRMSMLVGTFDMLDNLGETSGGLQDILDGQVEAMEKLTDMVPEIRTQQQIAADLLDKALGSPSAELRAKAQEAYDLFLRNTAIMEARREAQNSAGKDNPFDQATKSVLQNIQALEQQSAAFGLSETAAVRFNTAMDLLRAAEEAKIPITAELIEQINGLADAAAIAADKMANLQAAADLLVPTKDPFTILADQMAGLDELLAQGKISWQEYGEAAFRANSMAATSVLGLASGLTGALSQMFQDNKAFAVANAVVSTAEAVMKALSIYGPTPWGFAAAGVAAATGAAQIATILSANKGSSSRPNVGGSAVSPEPVQQQTQEQRVFNVTLAGSGYSREDVRALIEALNEGMGEGIVLNVNGAAA